MGYDKRYKKVKDFFLKKRFYLGLLILLPAFFFVFAVSPFFLTLTKIEPLLKAIEDSHLYLLYDSMKRWAYIFGVVAIISGLVVAYSLIRPARKLISAQKAMPLLVDIEEFGSLSHEFKDMAISLRQHVAAIEGMTGGVITVNRDAIITMANRQAQEMLDRWNKELIHTDIRKVFLIGDKLNEVILSGATITLMVNALCRNSVRLMECVISPIKGQDVIEGAIFNFRDISRIKEMQDELIKAERLATIGSLAMAVAHEVRNPLASIKGFAQLLKEDIKDDDPKALYLNTIIKEVDRLNRVVSSLYEMRDLSFEADSLRGMLKRIRLMCEQTLGEKRIEVIEDYDKCVDSYTVGDEKVFHGIYNVLLNAYESVGEGGSVHVVVGEEADGIKVEIVSDSELKEEVKEKIFEQDVTTKGKSHGAGLRIARTAMRQAGGDITVFSSEGKTTFTLWLPKGVRVIGHE